MAKAESVPHTWAGQEVCVLYVGRDGHRSLNCKMQEGNELGIAMVAGEKASFFPWSSVTRVDLVHGTEGRDRPGAP
jgi:hypothetical protein